MLIFLNINPNNYIYLQCNVTPIKIYVNITFVIRLNGKAGKSDPIRN